MSVSAIDTRVMRTMAIAVGVAVLLSSACSVANDDWSAVGRFVVAA